MSEPKQPPGKVPVLLVEDDEDIRELLTEVLESENYVVTSAARGSVALELLQTAPPPALILVDLTLPDITGAELVRRINDLPARKHAKLLLCSGQDNLATHARELHADGFIRKPYSLDAFLGQLAEVLK